MAWATWAWLVIVALLFTTTILVCAIQTLPVDCNFETAIDVTLGPGANNEIMCGKYGQAMLASTVLAPEPGKNYAKILCRRINHGDDAKSTG